MEQKKLSATLKEAAGTLDTVVTLFSMGTVVGMIFIGLYFRDMTAVYIIVPVAIQLILIDVILLSLEKILLGITRLLENAEQ